MEQEEQPPKPYVVVDLADMHLPRWTVGDHPVGGTPFSHIPGLEWIEALPYGIMESDTGNVIGGFATEQHAQEFVHARNAWEPAS